MSDEKLPTGITELDRKVQGGFLKGSLIAVVAPPNSQSEVILEELSTEHRALYLSTSRSAEGVIDSFESHGVRTTDEQIQFEELPPESLRESVLKYAKRVGNSDTSASIIVDTMNMIEAVNAETSPFQPIDKETSGGGVEQTPVMTHVRFLNNLKEALRGSESVCYIHCIDGDPGSELRDLTLSMADIVLQLRQSLEGEEIETRLTIPKFRGDKAVIDTIKINLTDHVAVDTSRDIA